VQCGYNENSAMAAEQGQLPDVEAAIKEDAADVPVLGREEMSKRARKRLAKRELWLEQKSARRAKQRLERKRKVAKLKEEGKLGERPNALRKRLKEATMAASACKVGVVIDFSFDGDAYMHQRDLGKACKQILRCYSLNRRLANPMQFSITGLKVGGRGREELSKHEGFVNWDVNLQEEDYNEVWPKDKIVYLTSESDNVVDKLEGSQHCGAARRDIFSPNIPDDHHYIIGGLVDHNRHKGLCHRLATEKGVRHARLPLQEHVNMATRKVLTIDHVFQILSLVTQDVPWKEAIMSVLPARKGISAKEEDGEDQPEDGEEIPPQDKNVRTNNPLFPPKS